MSIEAFLGFVGVVVLAAVAPGPNIVAVVSNALRYGLRGAAFAITGNLIALFLVAGTAAFGLGSLLRAFPDLATMMKLAGATYLIWVGWRALRTSFSSVSAPAGTETNLPEEARSIVAKAMLISLSNPKSVLFVSSVFPAFLNPSANIASQFMTMLIILLAIVCIVHSGYAVLAMGMRSRLQSSRGVRWIARASGLSFIALGLGLFVDALRVRLRWA